MEGQYNHLKTKLIRCHKCNNKNNTSQNKLCERKKRKYSLRVRDFFYDVK